MKTRAEKSLTGALWQGTNPLKMAENTYRRYLEGNRLFVESSLRNDPQFFERLASAQAPKMLWIGCSDSRVPANQITSTLPGEVFVHRNIANVVVHTDMNCLSVLEYAVGVLKVEHVVVCGHYGCGGVEAALKDKSYGVIDNWLRHIKDVYRIHEKTLQGLPPQERLRALVRLNVREQVINVCATSTIQRAWEENQGLPQVHGWVYDISNGLIEELAVGLCSTAQLDAIYHLNLGDSSSPSNSQG